MKNKQGRRRKMQIRFIASDTPDAQKAKADLIEAYGQAHSDAADVLVVLGGDGTLLETLRRNHEKQKPIYSMNCGSVGFLLNPYRTADLVTRIKAAHEIEIRPLRMHATDKAGQIHEALAFNEVSLLRETRQAAKLKIHVDNELTIEELVCDGVLLSTPVGSTAYNFSAGGPILPFGANVLALTPISAFRPRRWRGALLPNHLTAHITVMEADKRPVSVTADSTEIRDVHKVEIHQSTQIGCMLLFDPDHNLEDRIFKEQFVI